MSHDGNAGSNDFLYRINDLPTPFQFSALGNSLTVGDATYTGSYIVMMMEYSMGLPFSDGIVWMYTGFTKTFGYFGRGAKPKNTTAAGKTATAQTGKFENGEELYNTWFSGWFPAENPRYVITVFKERGSGGASDCAPVFKAIADKITALESE